MCVVRDYRESARPFNDPAPSGPISGSGAAFTGLAGGALGPWSRAPSAAAPRRTCAARPAARLGERPRAAPAGIGCGPGRIAALAPASSMTAGESRSLRLSVRLRDAPSWGGSRHASARFGYALRGRFARRILAVRDEGVMAEGGEALFLASGARDDAEDVLGQMMHGRGRISSGVSFLFTVGERFPGSFDCIPIIPLDHLRVVESLSSTGSVTRMQFLECSLAFMPVERGIAFLIMKYGPKLETGVGDGESNIVSGGHVLRLVESRVLVPIEHRPYRIPAAESIALGLPRFFTRTLDHCPWVAGAANQDQSRGRAISVDAIERPEVTGFRHRSFRNDHDPPGRVANRASTAGAALAAHRSAAGSRSSSKARRKSETAGTPPKRPWR